MEAPHCRCSRKGNITYFCYAEGCEDNRQLCAHCRRNHGDHLMIEINNVNSLEPYMVNLNIRNK